MEKSPNLDHLWYFDCQSNNSVKCQSAFWMWRSVPFILLLVGVCGNIINLIVLSRPRVRKYSTTIYLIFLAVSDIMFLIIACLNDTIYSIYGIEYADVSRVYCRIYNWLRYTTGAFSVWLLVLMTIERTVLIKSPVFAKSNLSPKRSFILSLVLLLTIAGGNSYLIYGVSHDNSKKSCEFKHKQFMFESWNIIVLIFYAILPLIVIVIGNCIIAFELVLKGKHSCHRKPLAVAVSNIGTEHETVFIPDTVAGDTGTGNGVTICQRSRSTRKRKRISSTILVFTLSIFFLLTTLPFCIFATIRDRQAEQIRDKNVDTWRLLTVIMYSLLWSNFACNFFLYFACGSLFRQELKRMLRIRQNASCV